MVSSKFGNNLYKVILLAVVYHIWEERNARIFNNKGRDLDSVLKGIEREARTGVALGMKWRILIVIGCCVWLGISPQNS